ncbi:hypothetical protein SDC9_158084 [bioreactor metagenome]|uniref:Uncharacterized protein n=1 Tax=bioreactor metagenome TaxID=1076179 RepID=A0A645F980_9ZZZZ
MLVGHGYLSVGKALTLSPCDIFRNAAALLLRDGAHDGDEQLALAVESANIFLFKKALHTMFLELADGHKAVNRVTGEPADGFGHNQINFTRQRVLNHLIKAGTVLFGSAGNSFIRIQPRKFPVRPRYDVFLVVIHLRLVGGLLLLHIR